jgi:CTP synthase (UTP-ammonia lyase)
MVRIGVIGDRQPEYAPHAATDAAVAHASGANGTPAEAIWVATDEVLEAGTGAAETLASYDALIVAPGSPYKSQQGVLAAIEHARVNALPLLGTCGGFQHVVLEFARNVLGFADAEHAEYDPYASRLFVTPLSCSLAGKEMTVHIVEGSRAAAAYRRPTAVERYYCNFGLNLDYLDALVQAGLRVTGTDQDGEPRVIELPDHSFFVATLFVPQTSSSPASPHPLVLSLVEAAQARAGSVS